MRLEDNQKTQIARIENRFIFNAQYKLGVREQKVLLYLIANIDPNKDYFEECIVPVKDLEMILKSDGKKWGGIYQEMEKFCSEFIGRRITFDTAVMIDGKPFRGHVNWFQSVMPTYNEKKEVCVRFLFSSDLKPFLLQLKEYAQINRLEVAKMRSAYSIRLFQVFKAQREKFRRHRSIVEMSYELEELKKLLGASEKYDRFNNFRQRVLDVAQEEINSQTTLHVEMDFVRNSAKEVSHVKFKISDNTEKFGSEQSDQLLLVLDDVPSAPPQYISPLEGIATPPPPPAFIFEEFKKKYRSVFAKIKAQVTAEYETFETTNNINFPNKEIKIKESVEAKCRTYFNTEILKNK